MLRSPYACLFRILAIQPVQYCEFMDISTDSKRTGTTIKPTLRNGGP